MGREGNPGNSYYEYVPILACHCCTLVAEDSLGADRTLPRFLLQHAKRIHRYLVACVGCYVTPLARLESPKLTLFAGTDSDHKKIYPPIL